MLQVLAVTALLNAAIAVARLQDHALDASTQAVELKGPAPDKGSGGCDDSGGGGQTCTFEPAHAGPNAMGAKILGKSGKVMLYRATKDSNASDTIKFDVKSLWEVLSDGSTANSGQDKHGFNNFANLVFTPSNFERVHYGGDGPIAHQFNLSVDVGAVNSTLSTQISFFEESGSIANEGEVINVSNGSTKVNLALTGWSFCAGSTGPPCHGKNGEYVDVTFGVMGEDPSNETRPISPNRTEPPPNGTHEPEREPEELSLGGNATMLLSTLVQVDGQWMNMSEGFPKIKMLDDGLRVTVRVPRFNHTALYDPVMEYEDDGSSTSTSDGGGGDDSGGGDGGGGDGGGGGGGDGGGGGGGDDSTDAAAVFPASVPVAIAAVACAVVLHVGGHHA